MENPAWLAAGSAGRGPMCFTSFASTNFSAHQRGPFTTEMEALSPWVDCESRVRSDSVLLRA